MGNIRRNRDGALFSSHVPLFRYRPSHEEKKGTRQQFVKILYNVHLNFRLCTIALGPCNICCSTYGPRNIIMHYMMGPAIPEVAGFVPLQHGGGGEGTLGIILPDEREKQTSLESGK